MKNNIHIKELYIREKYLTTEEKENGVFPYSGNIETENPEGKIEIPLTPETINIIITSCLEDLIGSCKTQVEGMKTLLEDFGKKQKLKMIEKEK